MQILVLLAFLLLSPLLKADQTVHVVANFNMDPTTLNQALEQNELPAHVICQNWENFGEPIHRGANTFSRWIRKITTSPLPAETAKVVFMNIPGHLVASYDLSKWPKDKLVLFMWEPPLRLKRLYSKKLHPHFARIYTWDDSLVDNKLYFKFHYPVLKPMIETVVPFAEKKLCTIVSGYASEKFCRTHPNQLYSERKNAIAFFEKVGEKSFDFYGRGWKDCPFTSYRGDVEDKIGAIKNYKFSICYENCGDKKGYITEKIFDCFAAGNVPIYWGAPNVTDYIPKDCFIDRRDFASLDELYHHIKSMSEQEYKGYLTRIRAYLKSPQAYPFSQEAFNKVFAEAVKS